MLKDKKILLGITGGIAAYKMCGLIRQFKQNGAEVKVIATPNALNFVTKLTLQTLSQNQVYIEQFDVERYEPEHISLADWADVFVIAPLSANTLSKLAMGICDNLLTSIACAFKNPIVIAPAMNCNMWANAIIQENLAKLEKAGGYILQPEEGFLACGYNGAGRLCKIEKIFDLVTDIFGSATRLSGKKVVITAGGTIEKLDSVRYISNFSSGKMGLALADEAHKMGAEVVLISTVPFNRPYSLLKVESALEMLSVVEGQFEDSDILIMAAAVADYRAKNISEKKVKKVSGDEISVELVKNPDILKQICARKTQGQKVVGFAAESENLIEYATEKINAKGCDYIVANDISRADIGFSSDFNEVYILDKRGIVEKIEKAPKRAIAKRIFEVICS